MKAFALAALAIPMVTAPALAGPYVSTKSEFKFSDANYKEAVNQARLGYCLLYTSPSPRDKRQSRMPSSA